VPTPAGTHYRSRHELDPARVEYPAIVKPAQEAWIGQPLDQRSRSAGALDVAAA
jgi:hypothetical protein